MIPGQYFPSDESIIANVGKSSKTLSVRNTGDRPIQVGSHTHFFEANKALEFPRRESYGCHLNIPSGTSIRFEPGESKEIQLTEFGGKKIGMVFWNTITTVWVKVIIRALCPIPILPID